MMTKQQKCSSIDAKQFTVNASITKGLNKINYYWKLVGLVSCNFLYFDEKFSKIQEDNFIPSTSQNWKI